MSFEWVEAKDRANQEKHGVSFAEATEAFSDPMRYIAFDKVHSIEAEQRYFCYGLVGSTVLTIRFTVRGKSIRIFGAAHWRKGAQIYENRSTKT